MFGVSVVNEPPESPSEIDADNEFASFAISLCFRSEEMSGDELADILQLHPTATRARGVPWPDGGGGDLHHIYFQCEKRFVRRMYAFDEFEQQLCSFLRPFAGRLTALAEVRTRCQRVVLACFIRTSGGIAMVPFSPETLQLLATVGLELHLSASTRATRKNRYEGNAEPGDDPNRLSDERAG
jgi:hypothetical protein